jgi:hypothetical protein
MAGASFHCNKNFYIIYQFSDNVGTLKQLYKKMTDTKQITEDSVKTLCPDRRIVKPPEKMQLSESTEAADSQKLMAIKRKKNDLNLVKRKVFYLNLNILTN